MGELRINWPFIVVVAVSVVAWVAFIALVVVPVVRWFLELPIT